jgi:hypothetical protein
MAALFSLGDYECPAREHLPQAELEEQVREHHPRASQPRGPARKLSPGSPDPSGPPGRAREVGAQFPDRHRRDDPAARSLKAYARRALVPTPPRARPQRRGSGQRG